MRRVLRLARILALVGLGLVVLIVAVLFVGSRTGAGRELVRRQVLALLADTLDAEVTLGGTGGTVGRSLVLYDLRIAVGGRTIVAVPQVEIVYALAPLLHRRLHVRRLTLVAPSIRAVRTAAGWRLPATRPRESDGGSRLAVQVDHVEVRDGRIAVTLADASPPRRLAATSLQLAGAATLEAERGSFRLTSLDVVPRGLAVTPLHASGDIVRTGDTVTVRDLDVASSRSRIVGAGRVERGRRVDARLLLAPLDARELRAVAPGLRLRPGVRAVVQASGPWDAVRLGLRTSFGPGGRAEAAATVALGAAPVSWDVTLRATALDPAALVDGGPAAQLNGVARARGAGFDLRAPLRYGMKLERSEITGHPVERLTLAGEGAGGTHRIALRAAAPAGRLAADARVALGPEPRYRLTGRLDAAHLEELVAALPGHGTLRLAAAGRGTEPRARRGRLRAVLANATLRGVGVDRGDVHARLEGEQLRVTRLELQGPALRSSGSASADLGARMLDAELEAAIQLAALGAARGGSARLAARARGPFARLGIEASVTAREVETAPASIKNADLTLELRDLGTSAPGGQLRLVADGVLLDARAPRTMAADATWRRDGSDDRVDLALTGRRGDAVTDRFVLALARTPARMTGDVRELQLTLADQPWQLVHPARFEIADGSFTTAGIALAAEEQRVTLAGRAGVRGALDAALETAHVRVGFLCALASGPSCGGELGGRMALTGTAADPRLAGSFTAAGMRVDTVAYGDVHLEVRYAERRAAVDAALRHPEAGELRLTGTVPVDLTLAGPRQDLAGAPVDLHLQAARLDLTFVAALVPREVHQSAGRLTVDVRVTGPRASPRADGRLALAGGRIELAAAGVPYEDVQVELMLAGDSVEVRTLHARAGGGSLDGRGHLALAGDRALDLALQLDDFFVLRREEVEAQASGAIALRGTLGSPDVAGTLEVTRAVVRPAGLPVSGPSLERDATIAIVGRPEPPPVPPSPASRMVQALRLAVDVRIARNAWIRRGDANIELGGALRLDKAAGEPVRLSGVIRLLRGWYAFQGRRFEIDEGTIRFLGNVPPQPVFDITANYRSPEYRIVVRVQGSSVKPTLKLSSDPPLEQADVLSVLLFGKPSSQLGRGESIGLQRQALQLASGYVAPELRTSVMNALGLDVLDVELQQGPDSPARVTVGRYVASDVFVSLAQEFGSRAAEVLGVEYGLTPRISVKGSTSTRGDSAIDLFWHRRY